MSGKLWKYQIFSLQKWLAKFVHQQYLDFLKVNSYKFLHISRIIISFLYMSFEMLPSSNALKTAKANICPHQKWYKEKVNMDVQIPNIKRVIFSTHLRLALQQAKFSILIKGVPRYSLQKNSQINSQVKALTTTRTVIVGGLVFQACCTTLL